MRSKIIFTVAGISSALILSACGGGDSNPTAAAPAANALQGLAATGAAIASGAVTARCVSGPAITGTTDANGIFNLPLTASHAAPCMLQVTGGTPSVTLHGFAAAAGRVNISPLTDLVVANALRSDPVAAFAAFDASKGSTIAGALVAAKSYVQTQITAITGASTAADPMSGTFVVGDADDQVLDALGRALSNTNKALTDLRTAATTGATLTSIVPAGHAGPPPGPSPTVAGLSPATGAAGASVTITGANLTAVTQVLFTGPSPATTFVEGVATAKTAGSITATVPATLVAGSYTLTVVHPGGEVTVGTFTVAGASGGGTGGSTGGSAGGAGGIGWSSAHVPVCNGVMAAPNTNGALALSWPAVNTATNYKLMSTQDDGVTVDPRSPSSLAFDGTGTLNTTATALTDNVSTTAGMVYKYTVQALNGTTFLCGFPQVTVAVGTLPVTTLTQQTFTAPRGGNFSNPWPSAATVGTTSAFLIDDGVSVSTGGSTWTKTVPSSGAFGNTDKLAASATTFVIAEGNIIGGTSGINTFRSTDAVTWTAGPSIARPTGASLGSASVAALTYTNGKFYLAMVYNTTAAAQVMALFSSADEGVTWTALNTRLSGPTYQYGYPTLIVANSTTLFLHTGGAYRGQYKSTDNGATWIAVTTLDGSTPVTNYTNETRVTGYVNGMFEGEQVVAVTSASSAIVRLYSADGITWTRASGNGAVVIDQTLRSCSTTGTYFDPAMVTTANGQLYVACSKGVVSSTDGVNWAYLSRSLPANFTPMAMTVNGSGASARTVLFGRVSNSVGSTTGFNLISVP